MSHTPLYGMDGSDYWAWYYDGGGMKLLDEFYRDVLKLNVVGFPRSRPTIRKARAGSRRRSTASATSRA